jgi:WD40 repeat protein
MTLQGHEGPVLSVVFSTDGTRIATGSWDNTAKIWDAATGKEQMTLRGHAGAVWSVAFTPDGKRLATASADETADIWDAATGKEQTSLLGHEATVFSAAFSPDGTRLATASEDATVQLYAVDLDNLLKLAHSRVTRDLTPEECKQYFDSGACPKLP